MSLPQLEEKIYSLVPELVHKTHNIRYHRYDYTYDEIEIKHWLPLLNDYCIDYEGWIGKFVCMHPRYWGYVRTPIQYNLKKSLSEQSEEFRTWLLEQLQS